ncbi:ATPase [Luteitalea sp. TBR-22]|uniref:AAA family ATPase n=1 Tax=Luteitalea sp. TBR-22 TaxID=2802971 RepID=UPI001AFBC28A|nr:AAA family ATPase [Luteitalea sp. TBR-22]BCS31425.1 ATPase [Luteitalea sp. TBR-22]
MPDFATCRQTLLLYLKARIPFISLRTDERDRALQLLRQLATDLNITIYFHTLSQGTRDIGTNRVTNDDRSVAGALDYASQMMGQRQHLTFILTEVQDIDGDTATSRQLLDVASSATERGGSVVVVTTSAVWPRLQRQGMTLTLDPPSEDEMQTIISECLEPYRGGMPIEWQGPELVEASTILAGVTQIEAENAIATLLAKGSILRSDLEALKQVKDRIFSDISGLERVSVSRGDAGVGGLSGLRVWLEKQRPLLTMDLRERGLRPPRGVLLVGVPGCGKSLSAKAIASDWGLPLYRLDLANIHGKFLGQSEGQLKEALATADRVAPCVLWIDEIEKGLGGSGDSDGGTSSRVLGHFLYWLQEGRARVFVVSTANDISRLPPELFRRGRFDELFFVDLPTDEERGEIIALYAKRYRLPLQSGLLDDLVQLSDGFAGSDLQAAVADVAKEAVIKGDAAVDEALWRRVFANVVPLSRTNPEAIDSIRAWGRERAVPASGQAPAAAPDQPKARRSVLA